MKKVLLFLFALLTTVMVWAYEFTPLQFGVDNEFVIESDEGLYLSFTPDVTDYYVLSASCTMEHHMAFNLWSDSLYYADSKPDALLSTHVSHCGYPNKLYAGRTYIMRLGVEDFTNSVTAHVVIRKGYLVSPDPECAELSNVLRPLPVVAYEGQEVNLTVNPGVTISGLTATSGGQPVAMTVDESGTVYTFTMPDADVVISGSYEMPSLQLGDNEIEVTYYGTQYAFVPEESGAYVFSMNCGAEAQVRITENNDYITIGYAAAGETVKVGAMLEANTTYYVVPAANAEDGIEGVILNIAKLELPPITVGENVIDVPYSNFFDYSFTPTESGDYRFYTTGDAEIRPYLKIYLGENMIGQCYYGNSDLDLTVSLEAGVTYTVKAAVNPDMPNMSVMHLNVTNEGGSSGGDDNVLQMGDNEVALAEEATVYTFTPTESGAYLFTMNCDASAIVAIADNDEGIASSLGYAEVPGQTICAGIMLEAGVTCQVATRLLEGSVDSAILNIAKYEIAPITLGENEIYAPFGSLFEYPFTPPVSGEYTFRTIGDALLSPSVGVFLGEDYFGYDEAKNEDAEFTATLEAGVTYTVRVLVGCYNASLIHLTVVSPQLAINLPESFEHGTVTSDKEAASIGETVTLTVTPDEGYELKNLTVTFTNEDDPSGAPLRLRGGNVELTPGDNGTYTFEMPAAPVTVSATFKKTVPTGVVDINAATAKHGQRYNLMGQPVGDDYKGIVIEDGKKRVIK